MTDRDRSGRPFEKLVAAIERAMGLTAGRKVEFNKRLKHLRTGKARQFDVVVTMGDEHHQIVTAIECKDHTRPVDVEAVEAFAKKVKGCPVHRGIMVASNGFTADARAVAADAKIDVMTLQEAENFNWIAVGSEFVKHTQTIQRIDIHLEFAPPVPDISALIAGGARFIDSHDVELDSVALSQIVRPLIPWGQIVPGGEAVVFRLIDQSPSAVIVDSGGNRLAPRAIVLFVRACVTKELLNVELHNYSTPVREVPVASSDLTIGGQPFKLVMLRNSEREIEVSLIQSRDSAKR